MSPGKGRGDQVSFLKAFFTLFLYQETDLFTHFVLGSSGGSQFWQQEGVVGSQEKAKRHRSFSSIPDKFRRVQGA